MALAGSHSAVGHATGAETTLTARRAQIIATGPMAVVEHPDPLALLRDREPGLAANKKLVFDMWRSIVNAGHVELADEMLQPDYIQHSPVLPTGRAAFKQIFSAVKRRDIPDLVSPPLVTILGEGDLVVMALREELPEPSGVGRYTTTHFNMFRIIDGRLGEHWHSIQDAPRPGVLPAAEGGPQRVTGASGAAQIKMLQADDPQLAMNKRLVFDAWLALAHDHDPAAAGHFLTKGYVEHDPNGAGGTRIIQSHNSSTSCDEVSRCLPDPLVAVVSQGDLVVLVTAHVHPFAGQASDSYTTTWFDMFRIENGRIAEHWNGAIKPGTPAVQYGN